MKLLNEPIVTLVLLKPLVMVSASWGHDRSYVRSQQEDNASEYVDGPIKLRGNHPGRCRETSSKAILDADVDRLTLLGGCC